MVTSFAAPTALNPVPLIASTEPGTSTSGTMVVMTGPLPAVTVTVAKPNLPLNVCALTLVVPMPRAVARPCSDTPTISPTSAIHTIVPPVSGSPAAFRSVALNVSVSPNPSVAVAGSTVTVATVSTTVASAVADLPSTVALMLAVPAAIARTRPCADTTATALSLVVHATGQPCTRPPVPLRTRASSDRESPCCNVNEADGPMATLTTVSRTVIVAVSPLPSTVAVMRVRPPFSAVTTPSATVATFTLSLVHTTVRPVSVTPRSSFSVAVSAPVLP